MTLATVIEINRLAHFDCEIQKALPLITGSRDLRGLWVGASGSLADRGGS
jgi:hypothetical protein